MAVKGAGGRGMSGGGSRKVPDGGMGDSMKAASMSSGGPNRTRRSTDAGRDTESHLAGDMAGKRGQSFGGATGTPVYMLKN